MSMGVWTLLGKIGFNWRARLFNKILVMKRMPEERCKSMVNPITKAKKDI